MPLPKSCSVAARATEAYAEAWSVVLNKCWGVKAPRDEPLPPLIQLLPLVRQLLTCCACAGLLEDAMISVSCGHCYCARCQHGTPLLKIQCRQCKERMGLVAENQLQLLVKCYRHMCHVISDYLGANPSSTLHRGEFALAKGKEIPEGFNPVTELLAEVVDGVKVSRTVLFVLPPQKYLNPKPLPDPPAPKKEQISLEVSHPAAAPPPRAADAEEINITQTDEEDMQIDVTETPDSPLLIGPLSSTPLAPGTSSEQTALVVPKQGANRGTRGKGRHKLPSPLKKWKKAKPVHISSAWFHGSVEFLYPRPASRRGTMKLFFSLKLLRLKLATLPCLEADPEVKEDCLNEDLISSSTYVYNIRQELPSTSFLPRAHRLHCSCLPSFPLTLRPKPDSHPATPSKKNSWSVVVHPRNPFTPHAKHRLLRRKYKSPYLNNPHSSQQRKLKQGQLGDGDPGGPSKGGATSVIKKRKRSPMTPGNWRCRCGTNNPQTFDRICARGKCPCFVKNIPCTNCLCRHCKNPFNSRTGI